jgi:hypothetical protein
MRQKKIGMKRHITGNRRAAIEKVWSRSCEWRTAEFLDGLQSGTHRGKDTRQTSQHVEGWD